MYHWSKHAGHTETLWRCLC